MSQRDGLPRTDPVRATPNPTETPRSPATDPTRSLPVTVWRLGGGDALATTRKVAEELPVAFTYNRATHAVMLATPADLEDFAVGFSLSEGVIRHPSDIEALEVVPLPAGIELRMDLAAHELRNLTQRQRRIAGPSGCGLCGMDSLLEAIRPVPTVASDLTLSPAAIATALDTLWPAQVLNRATRAVHAAGFWTPAQGLVALREDIGRHNALDKLAGALARLGVTRGAPGQDGARLGFTAADGVLLLSSRVSVEMAQKAAILGVPIIVAVSAPTALAIRIADEAGITLIGIARADGFEVFTHPHRIQPQPVPHVA